MTDKPHFDLDIHEPQYNGAIEIDVTWLDSFNRLQTTRLTISHKDKDNNLYFSINGLLAAKVITRNNGMQLLSVFSGGSS